MYIPVINTVFAVGWRSRPDSRSAFPRGLICAVDDVQACLENSIGLLSSLQAKVLVFKLNERQLNGGYDPCATREAVLGDDW